ESAAFGGKSPSKYALFNEKAITASKHHAKGLLIVNPPNRDADHDELYEWNDQAANQNYRLPMAQVSRDVASALLAKAGMPTLKELSDRLAPEKPNASKDMAGVSVKATLGLHTVKVKNVIGMLRGDGTSDEYIVMGAHYDHLGISTPGMFGNSG